ARSRSCHRNALPRRGVGSQQVRCLPGNSNSLPLRGEGGVGGRRMKDEALAARCRGLRLVVTDVDGVLTDGTVLLLADGGEAKAFHVRDGLAVVLAHRAGLRIAILSGRSSDAVTRRARELGIETVRQGVSDKGAGFAEILAAAGLASHQAAYIGDDVNDLPAMLQAGLSGAPADAAFEVRAQA